MKGFIGIIVGIFISCLFIQWNTSRISHKLDDILFALKQIRDGDRNG